jgi:hypothetical protein
MTTVELDEGEKAALVELLKRTIAADPFPLSPRVRTLRGILDKLQPPSPRGSAVSRAQTGRHAEPIAGAEERATALARYSERLSTG